MPFCSPLHVLKMRIPAVLRKELDDVGTLLPVNLECVRVLIMNVILKNASVSANLSDDRQYQTYLNRHRIDMNSLFDSEIGNKNVESLVEDADNSGRADHRAILLRELRNQHAEEEVHRLFLRQLGRLLLDVALMSDSRHCFWIEVELHVGSCQDEQ
jgi:hypothetical protein